MKIILLTLVILLNKRIALCEKPIITSLTLNESLVGRLYLSINWSCNSSEKLDRFLVSYDSAIGMKAWSDIGIIR